MSTIVMPSAQSDVSAEADLLGRLERVAVAAGRSDMSERLTAARDRLHNPTIRILVIGQSGSGATSMSEHLGPLLTDVELTDVPGVSARNASNADQGLRLVPTADAVLFVTDASQEFTAPELEFIQQIHRLCPTVVCVLTKIDMYSRWADIQRADRQHLTAVGLGLPILPVSSFLKSAAVDFDDEGLVVESGFLQLRDFLTGSVIRHHDVLSRAAVSPISGRSPTIFRWRSGPSTTRCSIRRVESRSSHSSILRAQLLTRCANAVLRGSTH